MAMGYPHAVYTDLYEVERIVSDFVKHGVKYYRVKWRWLSDEYCSLEPADTLEFVYPAMVDRYETLKFARVVAELETMHNALTISQNNNTTKNNTKYDTVAQLEPAAAENSDGASGSSKAAENSDGASGSSKAAENSNGASGSSSSSSGVHEETNYENFMLDWH